jgi:DNA-binding response OmpR family regulator
VNAPAAGQRLLIVDDEEALAKVMQRTLRSRGFEADVAFTAAGARQQIEANDYALTLLDVRLPDESGYGLLEELRARRPDTAVVMISGVDDPELGRAALEHGAYGYVVKPVGATMLYLTVVNNLRRRTLELDYRANLKRLEAMVDERAEQMRRAVELQAGMLPASPFKADGFEIAAHFTAAREISGDFYDWYVPRPQVVSITLGDVMGKGLPAALMMATARAALRGSAGEQARSRCDGGGVRGQPCVCDRVSLRVRLEDRRAPVRGCGTRARAVAERGDRSGAAASTQRANRDLSRQPVRRRHRDPQCRRHAGCFF